MSSVAELRVLAKTLGIKGYSVSKKQDLIKMIETHQQKKSVTTDAKPVVIDMVEPKQAEEVPKPTEVVKLSRKQSEWNSHLAEYRKEHGCSLREAMAKARESYTEKKQAKPATHDLP